MPYSLRPIPIGPNAQELKKVETEKMKRLKAMKAAQPEWESQIEFAAKGMICTILYQLQKPEHRDSQKRLPHPTC